MQKLGRFFLLVVIYILLVCFSFLIIPSISWCFGGEFIIVLQHPAHILFGLIVYCIMWGIIFAECFDEDFMSK